MERLKCKACGCYSMLPVEVAIEVEDEELLSGDHESRFFSCHVCGDNWLSVKETPTRGESTVTFVHQMGMSPVLKRIAHLHSPVLVDDSMVERWDYFLDDEEVDEERVVLPELQHHGLPRLDPREDALHAALAGGRLGGAVLDVWWVYPRDSDSHPQPSRHDFAALPNVIMSPHISGWTRGTIDRRWTMIADNLRRLAEGRPLENVVRPPVAPPGKGEVPS